MPNEPVIGQTDHQQGHADQAELKETEGGLPGLDQHGVDNAVGRRAHQSHGAAQGGSESHGHEHLARRQLGLDAHAQNHGHGHHGGAGVGQHGGEQAHGGHGVNQQQHGIALGEAHGQRADLVREAGNERGLAHDEHGHEQDDRGIAEIAEGHLGGNDVRQGKRHRHQQGGDGQGYDFGEEHDRRRYQDAQRDVGLGGVFRQFYAHARGGESVLPRQHGRQSQQHHCQ